ncbi:MAG: hypothetical protein ACRDVE_03800 [Actinocrinis sp.]
MPSGAAGQRERDARRASHGSHAANQESDADLAPPGGALVLPHDRRLVVPVVSGSGGVGRTTVAALLAAALQRRTIAAPGDTRGTALLDCGARGGTPWPAWVSAPASGGTGTLAGYRGSAAAADADLAQLTDAATSHLALGGPDPLWVLTDTGPASGSFLGADPGPRWWLPVLPSTRVAVVDGDALEGARLAAQVVGGPVSVIGSWFATPFLNTAAVWVTDTGEGSLQRTMDALTCIAELRMPIDRIVVALVDRRGARRRGGSALPEGWRELIVPRVGALVGLGHDRASAEQGGRPALDPAALDRPDVVALVRAVVQAARLIWVEEGRPYASEAALDLPAPGGEMAEMLLRQAGRAALR